MSSVVISTHTLLVENYEFKRMCYSPHHWVDSDRKNELDDEYLDEYLDENGNECWDGNDDECCEMVIEDENGK